MPVATYQGAHPPGLGAVYRALAGFRFPVFVLALLLAYELLLLVMLLLPAPSALEQFAEEFRTWCFGYDPATGKMQPMYVAMMLSEPIALCGVIGLVWWTPLKEAFARSSRRELLAPAAAAWLLLLVGVAAFGAIPRAPESGELPLPADELRTEGQATPFELQDHEGRPAALSQHQGEVVILTGVYASCSFTCPMIMGQTKRALAQLTPAERARVRVLAITLDPKRDDGKRLAAMATAQGVSAPQFRLLTGAPAEVDRVLDSYDFARSRNPDTGVIDHANLFLIIDKRGRLAYRFTLGARQELWLLQALRKLVAEPPPG